MIARFTAARRDDGASPLFHNHCCSRMGAFWLCLDQERQEREERQEEERRGRKEEQGRAEEGGGKSKKGKKSKKKKNAGGGNKTGGDGEEEGPRGWTAVLIVIFFVCLLSCVREAKG